MTSDWTKDVPDEQLAMVRLSCGHAKIVLSNVGVPGPGSSTWCDQCGETVGALRYVACGSLRLMGSQNADSRKERKAVSKTTTRPLCCTRCGEQVRIGEEAFVWADCGPAVIGDDGMVRTPQAQTEGYTYEPHEIRAYAVCPNPDCGHRWRLRRPITADPS